MPGFTSTFKNRRPAFYSGDLLLGSDMITPARVDTAKNYLLIAGVLAGIGVIMYGTVKAHSGYIYVKGGVQRAKEKIKELSKYRLKLVKGA